jgi:hypothetical protein
VIEQKSFHRVVSRSGEYDQKKHHAEIKQVLERWSSLLSDHQHTHSIYLLAPGHNRDFFYYEGSPLSKTDGRIKAVPFHSSRPNASELQKMFKRIAYSLKSK